MKTTVNDKGEVKEQYDDWKEYRDRQIKALHAIKSRKELDRWMSQTLITIMSTMKPETRLENVFRAYMKVTEFDNDFGDD